MKQTLRQLFDFQSFEQTERLQRILNRVEEKYEAPVALCDEDLRFAAAAGEPDLYLAGQEKNK